MVAGLLALFLGVAPAAAFPDSTPFERFAFRYETGWNDKIDTIDSTITRDNCGDPPERGRAHLSQKQLRPIYQRLIGMGAFSLPEPRPAIVDTILCSFQPSTWIRIDLRAGKTIRHYYYDRGGGMPCPPFEGDWQRLFQVKAYLDSVLQALPEYRRLPHKRCERL